MRFAPLGRAAALLFAAWLLGSALNLIADSSVDPLIWLLDLRMLPPIARVPLSFFAGGALALFGLGRGPRWVATIVPGIGAVLAVVALMDAVAFWRLRAAGAVDGHLFPASLVTALAATLVVLAARHPMGRRWPVLLIAGGLALAFPLLPMVTFGLTDYQRPADAALVFGARVYASGRLSDAADDRVRAAAALYTAGRVGTLVISGGPGDGDVHEVEAMARAATEAGVPAARIVLDRAGFDTRATARNMARLAAERGWTRVLAVSHFYHLPRIKIECERAGLTCFTVPATQARPLLALPWFMAREVAAWWRALLLPWI